MSDTAEKVTHSPLPWSVRRDPDFGELIDDGRGLYACEVSGPTAEFDKANAEFIVKAVNHHAELVRMLRNICGARDLGRLALIEEARELLAKVK